MELGLQGKRALVTGATKGLGRAIAESLLAEGAAVSICARTAEDVDKAVSELSASGQAIGTALDASDGEAVQAWVAESASRTALAPSLFGSRLLALHQRFASARRPSPMP